MIHKTGNEEDCPVEAMDTIHGLLFGYTFQYTKIH